jgi:hypothetical protein
MPTETVQGGPSYRADTTWWLPLPLRRALLLTPPFALAVLEVFHPNPDFNVQALLDASTWFAWFHVIQLVLTGLVALSVLLLAADYGRASAWTTRLGIGVWSSSAPTTPSRESARGWRCTVPAICRPHSKRVSSPWSRTGPEWGRSSH